MTYRNGITRSEMLELVAAADERFYNMEVTEKEYRELLGNLGLNATEIEEKIEENKP